MPLTMPELLADLPALLDLLSTLKDSLETTKGQAPMARDFAILEACLPKLKALALQVEAQAAS